MLHSLVNLKFEEKKKISQNIYMVHQCKICGLGALVF